MGSPQRSEPPSNSSYQPIQGCRSLRWWQWVLVVIFTLLPLAGGFIGARSFNTGAYKRGEFAKPSFAPASWVFSPCWSVSYICMGVASVLLVLRGQGINVATLVPIILYSLQLVACWLWTPLLFGFEQFPAALLDAGVMWALQLACVLTFVSHSRLAALLLLPALLWVSFAAVLNTAIVQLNNTNCTMAGGGL